MNIDIAGKVVVVTGAAQGISRNAGWMFGRHLILELEIAVLERVPRSNLAGSFVNTKHFAPIMIRGGGGRIIYMSNVAGAAYGGSEAAMNILTNVAHQELADAGIRTIALAPGLTDTPGMRDIVTDEHVRCIAASYSQGRIGRPDGIVALSVFLCSDAANHLSGTMITVRPPVSR